MRPGERIPLHDHADGNSGGRIAQGQIASVVVSDGGSGSSGPPGPPGADGSDFGWFNVRDYGAVGDGSTDDTDAINDAIDALNTAGGGVLYFPAGHYLCDEGLNAITVPCTVMGDGWRTGAGDLISQISLDNTGESLFTVDADGVAFRHLSLRQSGGTATAGAGITMSAGAGARFEDLYVIGFYDGIDIEDSLVWSARDIFMETCRRYGIRVRNTATPDAGDWSISGCTFSNGVAADAAIRVESSGGGRISDCKVNGGTGTDNYDHAINVAIADDDQTSVLIITGNSIENVSDHGIEITQAGTALYQSIIITSNQFAILGNTGKCVSMVAEDASGLQFVLIRDNIFSTAGTSRTPLALTKVDNANITGNLVVGNYTSSPPFDQSASTAIVSFYPGALINEATITSNVTVAGTTEGGATTVITSGSWTFDGVGSFYIVFTTSGITPASTVGGSVILVLLQDSTVLGRIGTIITPAASTMRVPFSSSPYRVAPSAGAHTFTVKAFRDGSGVGTATILAGAGGTGAEPPASLRIIKA